MRLMLQIETLPWVKMSKPLLPAIVSGDITGVVIFDVIETEVVVKFKETIRNLKHHFFNDLNQSNGYSLPSMFGQLHKTKPINLVNKYFFEIETFCSNCNEQTGFNVTEFLSGILTKSFKPYVGKPLPGFLPFSFRIVLPNKGGLFLHRDGDLLSYIHTEPSERIQQFIQTESMMSWFFTLQQPQTGGELWIADSKYSNLEKHGSVGLKSADGVIIENEDLLKHLKVKPPEGSLLMFKGGSCWHKVISPSLSNKERITLGGFMALGKDSKTVYYWS